MTFAPSFVSPQIFDREGVPVRVFYKGKKKRDRPVEQGLAQEKSRSRAKRRPLAEQKG